MTVFVDTVFKSLSIQSQLKNIADIKCTVSVYIRVNRDLVDDTVTVFVDRSGAFVFLENAQLTL